ncbi:MAG: hypothetical protein LC107_04350 [Chitinophagales bacterium]|nr:hypothetical protein [Chitinophagales bacterium]MCZ2100753.1 hypothetical protein [Chitinophagales bacterium]
MDVNGEQDNDHKEQFSRWLESIKQDGKGIIPASQIFNTSRAIILAIDSMKEGQWKYL